MVNDMNDIPIIVVITMMLFIALEFLKIAIDMWVNKFIFGSIVFLSFALLNLFLISSVGNLL